MGSKRRQAQIDALEAELRDIQADIEQRKVNQERANHLPPLEIAPSMKKEKASKVDLEAKSVEEMKAFGAAIGSGIEKLKGFDLSKLIQGATDQLVDAPEALRKDSVAAWEKAYRNSQTSKNAKMKKDVLDLKNIAKKMLRELKNPKINIVR